MTILDTIVEHKKMEVLKRKRKYSIHDLQGFDLYKREANNIQGPKLAPGNRSPVPGIIAEFKRKSPSKGFINTTADPVEVARSYSNAGAAAMSILTDRNFFGGSLKDLRRVREAHPGLCILRKDFMIDPFQVYEARAYGADIILLIAAVLSKEEVRDLSQLAAEIGLQVLLEVHCLEELDLFYEGIDLIGVNNRNLKDFSVDIHTSLDLIRYFPSGATAVSESGLKGPEEIRMLHKAGFGLFLMGERFMMGDDPGEECRMLIEKL